MRNIPRIVLAATQSGAGKTTLATALMACLSKRGYRVQPYKVGPDYIDPGYHNAATGHISRNLDLWLLGEDPVRELFSRSAAPADISIIEGVMGLYDGLGSTSTGSTAQVAKALGAPVVLILDVRSMARSAAAVALGFQLLDPALQIKGIILNRVGSHRHYCLVKEAVEDVCRVPVIGYVPRQAGLELPERHLGLLPTPEKEGLAEHIDKMAAVIEEGIDLDLLLALAGEAGACPLPATKVFPENKVTPKVKIGIVKDKAFNFYYQDALSLLEALGAEVVECSPFSGGGLPGDLHGLYIGGGFPEMFLEELLDSRQFVKDLRSAAASGMPLYAECGGLMFLASSVVDFAGKEYPAAGLIPGRCKMGKKRAALGYVTATALGDSILCRQGDTLRGHEFHYSTLELEQELPRAYSLARWGVDRPKEDGVLAGNILASYLHIHFAGCPGAAVRFLECSERYKTAISF